MTYAASYPGTGGVMAIRSGNDAGNRSQDQCAIRIAATGDIHLGRAGDEEHWAAAFADLRDRVDLILLAGDLTTHGQPEQGAMVAAAVRDVGGPMLAVLGNHDWHVNRRDEMVAVLREGRIDVLEREHRVLELCGTELGVAGCKGFAGGFGGSHIPDFGEPLLREVYAESMREAEGLDAALQAISLCPFRIALLHYAPITATLEGERRDIWSFLGTDRRGRGGRSPSARPGPRCATPPRSPPRSKGSGATSGRSSARTGSRCRCASIIRTSSCTATRTPAHSRAASTTCRCTTSRCRCWGRPSGCSR